MADHDLTPRGPEPTLDPASLRERVRARTDELRRRSVNRLRIGVAVSTAALVGVAGYGAMRIAPDADRDGRASTAQEPSSSSVVEPDPSTSSGGCDPAIGQEVSAEAAGLSITLHLGEAGTGTVAITNIGVGPVSVTHSNGGLNVIGLDEDGRQVTGGDPRARDARIEVIEEGQSVELPAYVHSGSCGGGGSPDRYVALVPFLRTGTGASGLAGSE